jgi:hypothetical protein
VKFGRGDSEELRLTFCMERCGGPTIVEKKQLSATTSLEDAVVENRRIVGELSPREGVGGEAWTRSGEKCEESRGESPTVLCAQYARTPRSESERASTSAPVISSTPYKIGASPIHCCNNAMGIREGMPPMGSVFVDFHRQSVPLFRLFMGLGIGAERACLESSVRSQKVWESGKAN